MTPRLCTALAMMICLAVVGCGGDDRAATDGGPAPAPKVAVPAPWPSYGSFVLSYDVAVADGDDVGRAIDQVIVVLGKRLDPEGVREIHFSRRGDSGIDIRVPLPSPEVWKMRESYLTLLAGLTEGHLDQTALETVLDQPDPQRRERLAELAGGDPGRLTKLTALAGAFDQRKASAVKSDEARAAADRAEKAEQTLGADATDAQRARALAEKESTRAAATGPLREHLRARQAYEAALSAVMADDIHRAEVERVFALPREPGFKRMTAAEAFGPRSISSPSGPSREAALESLMKRHPERKVALRDVVAAFNKYEAARGSAFDPEEVIAFLRGRGQLEFRFAAEPTADVRDYRKTLLNNGPDASRDKDYLWCEVDDLAAFASGPDELKELEQQAHEFFARQGLVGESFRGGHYLLLSNRLGERLGAAEPQWRLDFAGRDSDVDGLPAIVFRLNKEGGDLLGAMTHNNQGRMLTVVLDDRVIMAAVVRSRIDGHGQITRAGGFSERELNRLLRVLNAGRLKATLPDKPTSIKVIPAK